MRRLIAFIFMSLTLLLIAGFSLKPIYDNTLTGLTLKGGQEVIYRIKERGRFDEGIPTEKMLNNAANMIIERLDIAEVNNPSVSKEGDAHISVLLPNKSSNLLKNIRRVIEADPDFTFRDDRDDELVSGTSSLAMFSNMRFYVEDGVSKIEAEIDDFDLFTRFSENLEVTEATYMWLNFDPETDHLSNLGASSLTYDVDALKEKFIGAVKMDNDPQSEKDNAIFTITGHLDLTPFDETESKVLNKVMRAGHIEDYEIIYLQTHRIEPLFGTNSFYMILIFALLGLALGVCFLIYRHRVIGIVTTVAIAVQTFLSYSFFNFMNSEFGSDTLFGLMIGAAIVMLLTLNLGERLKNELYKGRNLSKAYTEASKKSLSTIVGSLIALMITALVLYFVSIRIVQNFATMILVSAIITLIIVQPLIRFMLRFVCNSNFATENLKLCLNVKDAHIPNVAKDEVQTYFGEYTKYNFLKSAKQVFASVISIGLVGILAFFMFFAVAGKGINIGTPYSVGTRAVFTSETTLFRDKDDISEVFYNLFDLELNEDEISVTTTLDYRMQEIYHVSIRLDSEMSDADVESLVEYVNDFNATQTSDVLKMEYVGKINQSMANSIYLYALLAALISIAAMFIFYSLFYKFTYSLAGIAGAMVDMLLTFSAVSLLQLQVGYEILTIILGVMLLSLHFKSVLFDLIKEQADNYKNSDSLTLENRQSIINKALQQIFGRLSATLVVIGVITLSVMFSANNYGFSLFFTILVGLISILATTLSVTPFILLNIEKNFAISRQKRVARRKIKKSNKKKSNEPEEFTFFGIND